VHRPDGPLSKISSSTGWYRQPSCLYPKIPHQGKNGDRALRDRQKTWQTYYDVTAEWMHTQTKQSYIFRSKVWADDVAKTPTPGQTVVFIVDLRHPQHSAVDVQSFS
jgi:hypothetical protein